MNNSKKHIIIGIICLISAVLQSILNFATFIPYLAFCLCSIVVGVKRKKSIGIVTILLSGLVALPFFEFIYSKLTASLMKTLFATTLILLLQMLLLINDHPI